MCKSVGQKKKKGCQMNVKKKKSEIYCRNNKIAIGKKYIPIFLLEKKIAHIMNDIIHTKFKNVKL